jgi:hypothetical protein
VETEKAFFSFFGLVVREQLWCESDKSGEENFHVNAQRDENERLLGQWVQHARRNGYENE